MAKRAVRQLITLVCWLLLLPTNQGTHGAQLDEASVAHFENRIRPALVKYCFDCHSDQDDLSGNLDLTTAIGWQRGGDHGSAIKPGKPAESLLYQAIQYADRDLQMPPENRLPVDVIEDFRIWIQQGAVDPRTEQVRRQPTFDLHARRDTHWAWQPMTPTQTHHRIDDFINEKLRIHNITPSPKANPTVLIRRLTFSLIGLPPTIHEIERFSKAWQKYPELAYEQLVDRLLNDPRFGEHWARHWLDVVRYCETKGHVTDQERPHAWKYRDYVIDALNDDLPFDQFVVEHLAGDLLPPNQHRSGRQGQTNVAPTATGFLFHHEMHFMSIDPIRQRWDEINAQIDVVGKAFLGLTTECARCHDHKFDAISQADYYALAGFFYNTELSRQRTAERSFPAVERRPEVVKLEDDFETYLRQKRDQREKAQAPKAAEAYFPISDELGIQSPRDSQLLFAKLNAIQNVDPTWALWVRSATDVGNRDVALLIRGDHRQPGELIPRRFLAAIDAIGEADASVWEQGSGRLWLAQQIANPHNPLTSRVWANRVWHHLFGRGIVSTPNNFGKLGSRPTHPDLLDYLGTRLIQRGWSTKSLIREILLSETWQRSSQPRPDLELLDPENRYWAHAERRRLNAEQLRDALLLTSGSLHQTMHGPSVDCFVPKYATATKPGLIPASGPLTGNRRRTIYLKVRRNFFDPFVRTFDFPDPGRSTGKRTVTTSPNQALAMLNAPFVHEVARQWGQQLASRNDRPTDRIRAMFLTAIGRDPEPNEWQTMLKLVFLSDGSQRNSSQTWQDLAHVTFNHADFMWLD